MSGASKRARAAKLDAARKAHGVDWWDRPGAAPLAATRRTPNLYSEGAQTGVIARQLGTPLLPWQQYAADIIGERRIGGEYEYQVVVVSVPRQSGKTALLRAVGVQRALVNRRDVFYTAQTGKDARARWNDLVKSLELSASLKERVIVRRAAGTERVLFPGGAMFQAFAPTPESLHGYTPPTVMLDEAFAHDERTGDLLMGAIGPAQMTIVDRQIIIVSTMGTAESVFLASWLERAIAGTPRVAVLLWAAADDEDVFDADTVAAFHPAVGFTINGKQLTAQHIIGESQNNTRAEYERAYANRATLTSASLVTRELYEPLRADAPAPKLDDLVLTFDVAHQGKAAAIVATWSHQGKAHSKVVMSAGGYAWAAGAVVDLVERWGVRTIAAHDREPTRELIDRVERGGVEVRRVSSAEFASATGAILQAMKSTPPRWTHDGGTTLAQSFGGLVARPSDDGAVFSRRLSIGDSAPAIAATIGAFVLDHMPTRKPTKPVYRGRS